MPQIGVVTVPFVIYEQHYLIMVQTILSLLGCFGNHKLDLIAVINRFDRRAEDLVWLKKTCDLVHVNDRNNLARAWNLGIREAFNRGADYALVINLDLEFHPLFIENLISFAKREPQAIMWSGLRWPDQRTLSSAPLDGDPYNDIDTSCFLIDKRLFELVGEFDEQFEPAYHEDKDMLYRIKLAGLGVRTSPSVRFYHLDRITFKGAFMNKDLAFLDENRIYLDQSGGYYVRKWGGIPGEEKYKVPFGE